MSPAKATRPGFRQSMAGPAGNGQTDQAAINLFHPIYHGFSYGIGCRVDIERLLPVDLAEEDDEELIDNFSEPPVWVERFSPLAVQVGDQVIRGKNPSDLMLKIYRMMFELFSGIGRFIDSCVAQNSGSAMRVPFMSLAIDPDALHHIIEADYESGETTYANLMKLFGKGTLAPCLTVPFHVMMPCLESDAAIRLCARSSFIFYSRILKLYSEFLASNGENGLMVLPYWLPEGAYSERVLTILREEFNEFCRREKLGVAHLLILLDNHQADFPENDVLMKSWNQLGGPNGHHNGNGNGRAARAKAKNPDLHDGVGNISVLFRDRSFSDWVTRANPSVKKLLDRTIAKVDSDINQQNVHYGWSHFEELEAIAFNPRSIINFQQKLVKLTELGYLPLSPDFYVRGKLRGEFGCTDNEPQTVKVLDGSAGNGWDVENARDLSRWYGLPSENGDAAELKPHPYDRVIGEGEKVHESGNPCWKVAWHRARRRCLHALVGDLETLTGGMAEILGDLTGQKSAEKRVGNVHDFLAHYTYVYWREHFIQHDLAEADINIHELCAKYLRNGVKGQVEAAEAATAGAAAQAIFFALESGRSTGTSWENMDQRAFYQNVSMLTLAMINAIYVYHWQGDTKAARKMLGLLKEELLDFEGAYERHDIAKLGVSASAWKNTIRSEVADSKDNVVRRAALRLAARHLRPLGFTKDFTRQDANSTTNVGHIWSAESPRDSFGYENPYFCGVAEE
ncbi:MAG: hypothetical protein ABFD69_10970 [Candidatus Sumerlaeia bacterium]